MLSTNAQWSVCLEKATANELGQAARSKHAGAGSRLLLCMPEITEQLSPRAICSEDNASDEWPVAEQTTLPFDAHTPRTAHICLLCTRIRTTHNIRSSCTASVNLLYALNCSEYCSFAQPPASYAMRCWDLANAVAL